MLHITKMVSYQANYNNASEETVLMLVTKEDKRQVSNTQ